jgi:hypothetical protein
MSSTQKRKITTYLSPEDFELFKSAIEKYDTKQADLSRDIIHTWLFNNKLQLLEQTHLK